MKVILYMAATANGMIAASDDSSSWISAEESQSYCDMVNKIGALIVGHRTYNILTKQPEYKKFQNIKLVVVATKEVQLVDTAHRIADSPKEALQILRDQEEVVVAGGASLNASFLSENFIDEIFIDIEPALLGCGIPLALGKDFECDLELLGVKNISKNEIQLHYLVKK